MPRLSIAAILAAAAVAAVMSPTSVSAAPDCVDRGVVTIPPVYTGDFRGWIPMSRTEQVALMANPWRIERYDLWGRALGSRLLPQLTQLGLTAFRCSFECFSSGE